MVMRGVVRLHRRLSAIDADKSESVAIDAMGSCTDKRHSASEAGVGVVCKRHSAIEAGVGVRESAPLGHRSRVGVGTVGRRRVPT
jgi:hypothetical protein